MVLLRPLTAGTQVVLIRRGRAPARGAWSLPGGAQRLGETAEQAARRELWEETGLTAGRFQLAAHADSIHYDTAGHLEYHYTILDFCAVWVSGEPVAGGDALDARWAVDAEFPALGLAPETVDVINASKFLLGL